MKKLYILFFLVIQFSYGNDMFWSKTGHRVIGEVAQEYLSGKAKRELRKLLGGETLASVANFADEIKADRKYSKFYSWHFVNIPKGKLYKDIEPHKQGDLITGIQECVTIVKNPESSKADKVFYLKMLVHLVGDLHQPMHVGRVGDKGGNDVQLQWFGRSSNLHRLWDSNMIDDYGLSYTELANKLPKLSKKEEETMQMGSVLDWVEESHQLANELYDSVEVGEKLGYKYSFKYWTTVEVQLNKGGVRLAKVLNDLFDTYSNTVFN